MIPPFTVCFFNELHVKFNIISNIEKQKGSPEIYHKGLIYNNSILVRNLTTAVSYIDLWDSTVGSSPACAVWYRMVVWFGVYSYIDYSMCSFL